MSVHVFTGNKETLNRGCKNGCIVLYHASWCGHCKDFREGGEWDKLKRLSPFPIYDVESKYYDRIKNDPVHQVTGYPTIRIFPGHGKAPVDLPIYIGRTADNIIALADEHIEAKTPTPSRRSSPRVPGAPVKRRRSLSPRKSRSRTASPRRQLISGGKKSPKRKGRRGMRSRSPRR